MADQSETGISWTDETWNPVVGCSIVSPACTNCYAMGMAARIERMAQGQGRQTHYAGTTKIVNGKPVWTGKLAMAPDSIVLRTLHWKRPRRVFVNSMSDLFHEDMPDEWIDRIFAVMALTPQHTFQVLTKRPERMRDYLGRRAGDWWSYWPDAGRKAGALLGDMPALGRTMTWPLPNVWLGVTAEDQARADERIPHLLATPAAVRFVSAEPLLGPLDLYNGDPDPRLGGHFGTKTFIGDWWEPGDDLRGPSRHGLDWVIVGGESGPGARPMNPDWVRSLRGQCEAAEVAFHFKQWGDWIDERQATAQSMAPGDGMFDAEGRPAGDRWHFYDRADPIGGAAIRLGKTRAGRTLDGVIHDAFPEARNG